MSRAPSAEARTLSLFTGRTDLEAGERARDGHLAPPKSEPSRAKPRKWTKEKSPLDGSGGTTWVSSRGEAVWTDGQVYRCRDARGTEHGPFASIMLATFAAEGAS